MVYEHRLRELKESCDCSHSTCDIHNYNGESLLRQHPVLRSNTLLLSSHSLVYCAVPKIATKALLTVMLYVHLRDINEHLNNNWTNVDVVIAQTEQRMSISPFINELRKVL
jgi:transposase-like protein